MSTFLDEMREHPVMKDTLRNTPDVGKTYLAFFTKVYNEQWPDFIKSRDQQRLMEEGRNTKGADVRQIAVLPEFISIWLRFINKGEEPSNEFTREFIKTHPVFWVRENVFRR